MKTCSDCGAEKKLEDFPRDATRADGRMCRCRECDNARSRRYYEANRDALLARMARQREEKAADSARPCVVCSQPTPTARHSYCDRCRPAAARYRERRRNSQRSRPPSREQGYGYEHKKMRERVARVVESGRAVCWRCGDPIEPTEPWDLGHSDSDRSLYAGPEHRHCNRATAGRKAWRQARQPTVSRRW